MMLSITKQEKLLKVRKILLFKQININMDYIFHHDKIIYRGQNRILEGYSERHHIIPKCMGGTDNPENIVCLTAREHYIIHQLLVKMYPGNHKLIKAAMMMTVMSENQQRSMNKVYAWIKRKNAIANSEALVGKSWEDRYGIKEAAIKREKLSKARTGKSNSWQLRPIIIDGIAYKGHIEAAKSLGVDLTTIYNWINKSKDKNIISRNHHDNKKPVLIDGIVHESRQAAAMAHNVGDDTIRRWIKKGNAINI